MGIWKRILIAPWLRGCLPLMRSVGPLDENKESIMTDSEVSSEQDKAELLTLYQVTSQDLANFKDQQRGNRDVSHYLINFIGGSW